MLLRRGRQQNPKKLSSLAINKVHERNLGGRQLATSGVPARVRISVQRGDTLGGHSSHKLLFKVKAIPGLLNFAIFFCFSMQFAEIGIRTAAALPTAPQPLPRTQGLSFNRTTRSQRGLKTYFRNKRKTF